jgi:hypothetical protein
VPPKRIKKKPSKLKTGKKEKKSDKSRTKGIIRCNIILKRQNEFLSNSCHTPNHRHRKLKH